MTDASLTDILQNILVIVITVAVAVMAVGIIYFIIKDMTKNK